MMARTDSISEGKITWKGPIYRVPVPFGKHTPDRNPICAIGPILRQWIVLLRVRPRAILRVCFKSYVHSVNIENSVDNFSHIHTSATATSFGRWNEWRQMEQAFQDLECLKKKAVGEPYKGKPHVRFEVAGDGNRDMVCVIEALPKETGSKQAAQPKF